MSVGFNHARQILCSAVHWLSCIHFVHNPARTMQPYGMQCPRCQERLPRRFWTKAQWSCYDVNVLHKANKYLYDSTLHPNGAEYPYCRNCMAQHSGASTPPQPPPPQPQHDRNRALIELEHLAAILSIWRKDEFERWLHRYMSTGRRQRKNASHYGALIKDPWQSIGEARSNYQMRFYDPGNWIYGKAFDLWSSCQRRLSRERERAL